MKEWQHNLSQCFQKFLIQCYLNNKTTTLLQNFQTQNAFDHRFLHIRILYLTKLRSCIYISYDKGWAIKDRLVGRLALSIIEKSINTPPQHETKSFRRCIPVKLNRGLRDDHQSHVHAVPLVAGCMHAGREMTRTKRASRVSFPLRGIISSGASRGRIENA